MTSGTLPAFLQACGAGGAGLLDACAYAWGTAGQAGRERLHPGFLRRVAHQTVSQCHASTRSPRTAGQRTTYTVPSLPSVALFAANVSLVSNRERRALYFREF
jgi:hypothetical protein